MATYNKLKLSSSTNGRGILVAATATPGTVIHTATTDNTGNVWDEVWLWAVNKHTADLVLTLEMGGTSAADLDYLTLPFRRGRVLICAGEIFNNGVNLSAFASVTNVISLHGFINRITN